jgi:predicted Rossmann-fold nucleotide-binding protein
MQTFIRNTLLASGAISEKDLDLAYLTDDPQDAVEHIQRKIKNQESPGIDRSEMS